MKQFLFLLSASLLACVSTLAQINHSFVEDGKVWLYNGRSYHWDEDYKEIEWEETYSLEGDTVIGSQQCLKLYLTCNSPYKSYDHAYIGAMYEESEKVYYIAPDNTTSTLLYDFSCDVGDIVKMNWYEIYYPEIVKWDEFELIINDKQLVKYRDKYMTVINWSPIDSFSGEIIDVCPIWIESIGSPIDLLNSTPVWNTGCISKELLTCKLNDQVIYDRDEFWTSAQYIKENEVTFTQGQMATIILPTAPDAGKGKYYRLDRCEGNEIIFEQELQPRARVPYIIVPSEDFSIDPSALDLEGLSNDTVSIDGISFIGTYSREELPDPTGGSFYIDIIDTTPDCRALDKPVVGALRAWLQVNWDDPIDHGGAKSPEEKKQIVLKDNPDGISQLVNCKWSNGKCYDLSGRRIDSSLFTLRSSLKKGIYIEDGRKKAVR